MQMNEVFERFTVKKKWKYEKEQEDIGKEFRQRKKKKRNEDDELFLTSTVVATTTISIAICLAKYFI